MRSAVRSCLSPPEKSRNLTISGLFLYFLPQIINFFSSLMERSSSPTVRPAVLRDAGPWSVSDTSEQESHALSPHSGMTGSRFHKLFHSQHQESGDIPAHLLCKQSPVLLPLLRYDQRQECIRQVVFQWQFHRCVPFS